MESGIARVCVCVCVDDEVVAEAAAAAAEEQGEQEGEARACGDASSGGGSSNDSSCKTSRGHSLSLIVERGHTHTRTHIVANKRHEDSSATLVRKQVTGKGWCKIVRERERHAEGCHVEQREGRDERTHTHTHSLSPQTSRDRSVVTDAAAGLNRRELLPRLQPLLILRMEYQYARQQMRTKRLQQRPGNDCSSDRTSQSQFLTD